LPACGRQASDLELVERERGNLWDCFVVRQLTDSSQRHTKMANFKLVSKFQPAGDPADAKALAGKQPISNYEYI